MRIANFGWIDLRIQSAESTSAFAGVQFHVYSLRKKILEVPDNFLKKVIKFYKKFCNQFPDLLLTSMEREKFLEGFSHLEMSERSQKD